MTSLECSRAAVARAGPRGPTGGVKGLGFVRDQRPRRGLVTIFQRRLVRIAAMNFNVLDLARRYQDLWIALDHHSRSVVDQGPDLQELSRRHRGRRVTYYFASAL